MADYRFARRPAWIAGHLLAGGMVALMVGLGFWQLDRLDQRRDRNALIEARASLAPVPVGEEVDPDDDGEVVDGLRFRSVEATGRYTDDTAVVRTNQSGASGARVFTVLALDGGESVLVLRGFIGQQPDGSLEPPSPPSGVVTIEGVAVPRARLELLSRQALDDLEETSPALATGLLPVIVQTADSDSDAMVAVPPPELGDGPHLSYALQWFLFSAVVLIGYPILLRRRAGEAPEDPNR